ncbi:MAG: hypothetical protein EPN97_02965 [Alphaproteobacteria bacterium]|nr:MAG: hypothetical protein EPN97_02965 [Alphaproteobacteria bacterium]
MPKDVFPKPGSTEKKMDLLKAILRERPDLDGKPATFPGQGQKGSVAIIGDEVFKGPQQPRGECLEDYETECDVLRQLEGKALPAEIPHITTVSRDYLFFGMNKVQGVQMGSDFESALTKHQQRVLAKDVIDFVVALAHALPMKDGKFAVHDDLYYNHILIDPETKRLKGVIDFGLVKYKSADEWKPMYDFEGAAFYDMLQEEFNRRKADLPGAAPAPDNSGPDVADAEDSGTDDEDDNSIWAEFKQQFKESWLGGLIWKAFKKKGVEEEIDPLDTVPLPPPGSQAVNFLWINLDLPAPPDPEDGSVRQPLPQRYIANVRGAAAARPDAQFLLWMDSKRLTPRQWEFLQGSLEDELPNAHLKDLRSIPAYDHESLYNEGETNPKWRDSGQRSLIWRQVDAAKILISLQGKYDQTFFADLDHAHLDIDSEKVQRMLFKNGLMIGSSGSSCLSIENQLWGFVPARRKFFEEYYKTGLKSAHKGSNAWNDLVCKVDKELIGRENLKMTDICLPIDGDNTSAEQPGHTWRGGSGKADKPALVDKGELTRAFNARCRRAAEGAAPKVQLAPANDDLKKPAVQLKLPFQALNQ